MPQRRSTRGNARPEALGEAPAEPSPVHRSPVAASVLRLQQSAGNGAVSAALSRTARGGTAMAPAPRQAVPVQRWAWVAGTQVDAARRGLSPRQKALASDGLVHDYLSEAEFTAHAEGRTDHLGNLPGPNSAGTWVRFSPAGMNVLGEDHTFVTLREVAPAVRSTSFVYEPFSDDDLPAGSRMKAAYERENDDRFRAMGVAGVADKRQFGAESLYPKMGYSLTLLLPFLTGPRRRLAALKSAGYVGQPIQRYLKIAWAHAADVAAAGPPLDRVQRRLARVHDAHRARLDAFITALPVDGFLGDALDTRAGRRLRPALAEFCQAFTKAMLARAGSDTTLTAAERDRLARLHRRRGRGVVFAQWREMRFLHAVTAAAARGVRYAGMGRNHLTVLLGNGTLPSGATAFDMIGRDLAAFETLTADRRRSVSP